ncbi:MAG: hypothetical protein QOI66_3812 [Myxococcales bacterium]|jgi:hypothetical protein|nr:hypothetical protein [Myxococcales bacterium]
MMGKIGALILIGATVGTLSGCVIDNGCAPDVVSFTWTIVDANNAVFTCQQAGATTVVINIDGTPTSFGCNSYGAAINGVPGGTHQVSFQLLDANGALLSQTGAMSASVLRCGGVDLGQVAFEIQSCQPQDVSLSWSIDQASNGAPLSCQDVGAGVVRLNLGNQVFNFDCNAGVGRTTEVAAGTYPTFLQLFSLNNQLLSETTTMNIAVPSCTSVTLPMVTFDVQ